MIETARIVTLLGIAGFVGLLLGWALLWPGRRSGIALRRLLVWAGVVLTVGTLAGGALTLTRSAGTSGLDGAAALVRLGVVAAVIVLSAELARTPVTAGRRVAAVLGSVVVLISAVAQAPAIHRGDWVRATALGGLQLLGASALVGALMIMLVATWAGFGSTIRGTLLARSGLYGLSGLMLIMVNVGATLASRPRLLAVGAGLLAVLIILAVVALRRVRGALSITGESGPGQTVIISGARTLLIMMLLLGCAAVIISGPR